MLNQFSRTQLLYGEASMQKLAACRVAVFGIGGVGGCVVEALARSGIGALDLFDFYEYDYVVDAIDTVTGKLAIIENAKEADTSKMQRKLIFPSSRPWEQEIR